MHLTQGLSRAATINPSGIATDFFRARRRTWAQIADRIARISGGFARLGVSWGDRVAILALNSDRYFEALFAVPALGAIIVPLNTRLAPPEIAFMLQDSGAKLLLLDDAFSLKDMIISGGENI
jgi:long-chain acyl-CoA synthetase